MISINSGLLFVLAVLALGAWIAWLTLRPECPECRRRERDYYRFTEEDDD